MHQERVLKISYLGIFYQVEAYKYAKKTHKKNWKTGILKEMFLDLDPDPFFPGRIQTKMKWILSTASLLSH